VEFRGSIWCAAVFAAVLASSSSLAAGTRFASRAAPASENAAIATDARLGGDEARTRFIVDLSRGVDLTAFTLADPYRVVIDLPQIGFRLPAKAGESGRGLVKAFRFGLVMAGGSRIVLDASGPVRIDRAFVLDPVEGQPARLVVDLVAVDRDTFLRNLALDAKPRRAAEQARKDAADTETAAAGDTRPVVVIDPGHGGMDGGTSAPSGESEKTIVLDFAQQLREKLEKRGKYRVVMTRTDDSFVPLGERVRIARQNKAALFISIHADAMARPVADTRGATVYTLSETASDGEAARLAEAENRVDAIAGVDLSNEPDDVADILIELTHRETKAFSSQFARVLVGELRRAARLHKQPLRSAGFKVLKAPDVPSVLVELGYVSSPQDLKLMTSAPWRERATDSIAQAVQAFFATRLAGTGVSRTP
jgi:N-acetylmuramoyl-L-alanine amidase